MIFARRESEAPPVRAAVPRDVAAARTGSQPQRKDTVVSYSHMYDAIGGGPTSPQAAAHADRVNALTVDQHVELMERDPDGYARAIADAAAVPAPGLPAATGPAGVIPAQVFNSLSAFQLAEVMEADQGLYDRSVQHWASHDTTAAPADIGDAA